MPQQLEVAFWELFVVAIVVGGVGFGMGYTLPGSRGNRLHREVCELRLAAAATAADTLAVVQDDTFCLEAGNASDH